MGQQHQQIESGPYRVGIVQMCSAVDPRFNIAALQSYLQEAKEQKAKAVFLPEGFYTLSDGKRKSPFAMDEKNDWQSIAQLAKTYGLALVGGSSGTYSGQKTFMRSRNYNEKGELLGVYDKINLFKYQGKDRVADETQVYSKGKSLCSFDLGPFHLGMTICFDLRFPELFRAYHRKGVNLFSCSSAFAVSTGEKHWHVLLRSRAIENQSYVVAAAQSGTHASKIKTYGHSLIVNPWGEVIVDMKTEEGIAFADLDIKEVHRARTRLNSLPSERLREITQ